MYHRTIRHQLIIPDGIALDEIKQSIPTGGRFIVFQYCISFLVISHKKFSPAIYLPPHSQSQFEQYNVKYNRYSKLMGWWAVPAGIGNTISCISFNKNGGLDVTEDIMLNLNEKAITNKEIELIKIRTVFSKPDDYDLDLFKTILNKWLPPNRGIDKLVVGYFINVDVDQAPYYEVGISTRNDFTITKSIVENAIRKEFFKQTHFEFSDLNADSEYTDKLIEQGLRLI